MKIISPAIAGLAWFSVATVAFAQVNMDTTPAAIVSDLRSNSLSAEEIRGLALFPSLHVISLRTFSGANLQKLEETLRGTEDGFAEVRTAIEANETLEAALVERGVPISSVTAATQAESGAITIYVDKPARRASNLDAVLLEVRRSD